MKTPPVLCREPGCGKPIMFVWYVKTKNHVAVNPDPDPAGSLACARDGTGTFRARIPTEDNRIDPHERLYMPHAATCAAKKNKPAPEPVGNVIPLFRK